MDRTDIERVGELFQEFTKYRHFTAPSLMARGARVPEAEKPVPPDAAIFELPAPLKIGPEKARGLFDFLRTRRSRRDYAAAPLTKEELGALLWSVQGVVEGGRGYTFRTAPSAGARHPLDTYIMLNRVEGLAAGHACQNLYLACEALGLGCCAVAAFDDDEVDRILGLDGREEFTIYLATVGRVRTNRAD